MLWRGISRPISIFAQPFIHAPGPLPDRDALWPNGDRGADRGFNLMGWLCRATTLLESSELRYRTVVGTLQLIWDTDADGSNTEIATGASDRQKAEEAGNGGWLNPSTEDATVFSKHWQEAANKIYAEDEVRIRGPRRIPRLSLPAACDLRSARRVVEWCAFARTSRNATGGTIRRRKSRRGCQRARASS